MSILDDPSVDFTGFHGGPANNQKFIAPDCRASGQEVEDYTRIQVDKRKQQIKFENETEHSVTVVIEPKIKEAGQPLA